MSSPDGEPAVRRKVCKVRNRSRPDPLLSQLDGAYAVSIWRKRSASVACMKFFGTKSATLHLSSPIVLPPPSSPTSLEYTLSVFRIRYQSSCGQAISEVVDSIMSSIQATVVGDFLAGLYSGRSFSGAFVTYGAPPFIPGLHPGCYLPPRRDLEPVDWRPTETIPEDFYAT